MLTGQLEANKKIIREWETLLEQYRKSNQEISEQLASQRTVTLEKQGQVSELMQELEMIRMQLQSAEKKSAIATETA